MGWSLSIDPLIPLWVIAVAGIVCLAMIVLIFLLKTRGTFLRATVMAALLAALLNPIIRGEERQTFNDILMVISDKSPSMKISKRAEQAEKTVAALQKKLSGYKNIDVRYINASAAQASANDGTRLFETVSTALSDVPPERLAGIILISDGQIHDIPEKLEALGIQAPIHSLLTGDQHKTDRRIVIERAPKFGIVGDEQNISFRIEDLPSASAVKSNSPTRRTSASVTVKRDGKLIGKANVRIGESINLPLPIDHAGQIITEITVAPDEHEITLRNNKSVIITQGIRDRLRVLLVSGEPHAGERTWRNLLKADAAVDLVHFTILRPPEKQDGTPIKELSLIAFPTRELFSLKLHEFDLVIFDRYRRRGVLPLIYLANVADYVEKGGAVLAAAGPSFATPLSLYRTPLSAILPAAPTGEVIEKPFRPEITDSGRRHPVTRTLPRGAGAEPDWGRWFRLIDVDPGSGTAVMSGPDDKPLLILKRQGKGRVAQLLSDHAWLWARGYDGGGPQVELLRRLAHWLMKEPDLEEEALHAVQIGNDLKIERHSMGSETPVISIIDPEGKTSELTLSEFKPGHWTGVIKNATPGIYELSDGDLIRPAVFGTLDGKEFTDVRPTAQLLEPVHKATGGRAFWLGEKTTLPSLRNVQAGRRMSGSSWLGLQRNNAYTILSLKDVPLLSGLLALAAVLGLMSMLWYREGH